MKELSKQTPTMSSDKYTQKSLKVFLSNMIAMNLVLVKGVGVPRATIERP